MTHTEDADKPAHPPVATRTNLQMGVLIAVAREMGDMLASGDSLRARDECEDVARLAASKTYELACFQMRNLIDDPARWQFVESSDAALEEVERNIAATREKAIKQLQRPSLLLNAKVRFIVEVGKWVAWVGELTNLSLHGAGLTPEQAMTSFDLIYVNGFPDQPAPTTAPAQPPAPDATKKPRQRKN
jgi:hypothetical protein